LFVNKDLSASVIRNRAYGKQLLTCFVTQILIGHQDLQLILNKIYTSQTNDAMPCKQQKLTKSDVSGIE